MKNVFLKLAAILLICVISLSFGACTDGTNEEQTDEVTTEQLPEPEYTPGTAYYPPGKEPVERPHPKSN